MRAPIDSYRAQAWQGEKRVLNINGLSVDAARHLAQVHAAMGETGRIMAESHDYTEVYCPDGSVRVGPFAETTLVRVELPKPRVEGFPGMFQTIGKALVEK